MRFASEYDKSVVAVQEAAKTRDRVYQYVTPALDSIAATEEYMPENHLFYVKEMARLKERRKDDKPFNVFRLKDGGHALPPDKNGKPGKLGIPIFEANEVAMIKKPYKEYEADLKKLIGQIERDNPKKVIVVGEIDIYEEKIREIAKKTKEMTIEMTGTDEVTNAYVQPGLYELTSMEFKYQRQIKVEIDAIKQDWSKAIENSGTHRQRRTGLEATLKKLEAAAPARKDEEKP